MTPRWPGTVETLARAAAFFDSILSPMAAMAAALGPMKTMPALFERLGKGGALGQKAVARMHRLRAAFLAGGDDILDHQIALRGRRRPDRDRRIRHLDMQRVAVGVGIDRDRFNAHAPGGLDDPAGDLAAIGNQDALEHCGNFVSQPVLCLCGVVVENVKCEGARRWHPADPRSDRQSLARGMS